jgi:putative nucleotidyltransferase with HDIG domain
MWKNGDSACGPYQTRTEPATAATDVHDASRARRRNFMNPPLRGTNGDPDVIPLMGDIQGLFSRFRHILIFGADRGVVVFASLLALAAGGLAVGLVAYGVTFEASPWFVLALGLMGLVAERQIVQISANLQISVSALPLLLAATLYGPLEAMAVAVITLAADFRMPYARWLTWTASRTLSGGLAGLAASAIATEESTFGNVFAVVVAAALTQAFVDAALGAATGVLRGIASFGSTLQLLKPVFLGTVPLYTPLVVLLIYASRDISEWSVVFFVVPAFAAHRFHSLYREELLARQELDGANSRLQRANLSFATALVATLDARDQYTAGHSAAVAVYARDIANRMNLSEEDQRLAHLCGLVHDIGKIGLPPGLLEKPGALTLEERRAMEEHSAIGERILANVEDYAEIARVVRHHHERIDGQGYPDGISGSDIPVLSRIIAVADAYNAMTSDRPYRDAMPSRVARLRLAQAVEAQFDTNVVAAFEAILASASEDYRTGLNLAFEREAELHADLSAAPIASVA